MLFFSASIRSTTFSPRGLGFGLIVLPLRFALQSHQRADRAALPVKLVWYDSQADPFELHAELWKVRRMCMREGGYFGSESHGRVQAIMTAIDEYAESCTGNSEQFCNCPVRGYLPPNGQELSSLFWHRVGLRTLSRPCLG